MAPLHAMNPQRARFVRDAICRCYQYAVQTNLVCIVCFCKHCTKNRQTPLEMPLNDLSSALFAMLPLQCTAATYL